MIEKPKLPKLPKHFTGNLESVASELHGKRISSSFAKAWKLTERESNELVQHLIETGMITILWLPEKESLCFLRKELPN